MTYHERYFATVMAIGHLDAAVTFYFVASQRRDLEVVCTTRGDRAYQAAFETLGGHGDVFGGAA